MLTWFLWVALGSSLLAAVVAVIAAFGARRWRDVSATLTAQLDAATIDATGRPPAAVRFDSRELQGQPGPVQRYFLASLKEGQPIVSSATVELAGKFNLSATAETWKPFTSKQRIVTRRPGFLWDAAIHMLPGLTLRVRDAYIAGQGLLRAAVPGLFTMADVHGDGEIARGELFRFLAEAAWYPTGLLPSQGVRWDAVDDRSADATLVDGPLSVTMRFSFDEAGLIDSVRAEARGAMVGKTMVMMPWEGRWADYRVRDGMTVPDTGEVAWLRPEGRRCYFRGTVISLDYEFAS